MDEAYYAFLYSGKRTIEGISIVAPEHLIPLKARAWLDLRGRREAGAAVDAKSIAKHKNDVFRLYRLLDPAFKTGIPKTIREDMGAFLDAMKSEFVDLENIEINDQILELILEEIRRLYASM